MTNPIEKRFNVIISLLFINAMLIGYSIYNSFDIGIQVKNQATLIQEDFNVFKTAQPPMKPDLKPYVEWGYVFSSAGCPEVDEEYELDKARQETMELMKVAQMEGRNGTL